MAMGNQMGSLPAGGGFDSVTRNRARRQRLGEMSGMAGPNNPAKAPGAGGMTGPGGGGFAPVGARPTPRPFETPGSQPGGSPPFVPWNDPGFPASGGLPDQPVVDEGSVWEQGQGRFLPEKSMGMDAGPGGGGMAGVYGDILANLGRGRLPQAGGVAAGTGYGNLSYGDDGRAMEMGPTMGIDPQPGGGGIPRLNNNIYTDTGPDPLGVRATGATPTNGGPPGAYDWMASYLGVGQPGMGVTPYGDDAFLGSMPSSPPAGQKPDMPMGDEPKPRPKPNLGPRKPPQGSQGTVDLKAQRRRRRAPKPPDQYQPASKVGR